MRDLDELTSWYADWGSLRVAVLGLGATGFAAADTLTELRCAVLVIAAEADEERIDLLSVIGAQFSPQPDREVIPPDLVSFDPELVVVSPGYARDHPLVVWARDRGIPIWGDIELAWRLRDKVAPPAHWNLVAGSSGVAPTSLLAAHLLVGGGRRYVVAGSVGMLALDAVRDPVGFDGLIVALSPAQLQWMSRTGPGALRPEVSVCLSIDLGSDVPAETFGRVYENTAIACVYNQADEATMHLVEDAEVQEGCRAIGFGLGAPGRSDLGMVGDIVVDRAFLDERHSTALELTTHGELAEADLATAERLPQVLAACAVARAHGVSPAEVRTALATFMPATG